jgi:hypothetical protein
VGSSVIMVGIPAGGSGKRRLSLEVLQRMKADKVHNCCNDVLDSTVVRVPKAYPAYFGQYREFGKVRDSMSRFTNLYPVGRNGMHRYNNQDHSMLSASAAVDSILDQGCGKSDIWSVNAEEDYHEEVGKSLPRSGNGLP